MIALHAGIPEKHKQDYELATAINHFLFGMKGYVGGLLAIYYLVCSSKTIWDVFYYSFFIDETLWLRDVM